MYTPPTSKPAPLRIVVADDSGFMRRLLTDALRSNGADVVGVAANGDEALALCRALRPDVLTLDLAMPGMDGIAVLRAMRESALPVPTVVVSAFSPAHGVRAVDALAEGAVELVAKPSVGTGPDAFFAELWDKVCTAAASRAAHRGRPATAPVRPAVPRTPLRRSGVSRAVLIACSTGGPKALADIVPKLPSPLGSGALIVQHMPAGFTASLAGRLDRSSKLAVREAGGGEVLDPATALLAPGGRHLRLNGSSVRLSDEPQVGGLRPRADLLIVDAARQLRERLVLVVLTGMGKDGLDGAREVKRLGGRVLAEAESTCTVYGMPRAVVEAGLADVVLPLHELPEAIAAEAGA
jgi:two-component system, chemotaxis family, protein-glutamate methylesterase/glutaminase